MKRLLGVLLLSLSVVFLYAQPIATRLHEYLETYAKLNKFNGSVLVAQKGNILLEKGYGLKNASKALPNDPNTIYQIGSVTKQFTAAVVLRLQEQKKLNVKDRLDKYFPDFPNAGKISIENLLTHSAGIYNYTNDGKFMQNEITNTYDRDRMIALFKDKPLDFEPGSKFSYSNSGYLMLGYIIEKVTGKPYEHVVHEYILQPLHMDHTGFDFTHLRNPDKAIGYMVFEPGTKTVAPIVDSTISFSAGALYSTVGDLYKWERAVSSNTIISPDSWKAAFTPYKNKYGYGWVIDSIYNLQATMHGGGIHGFNSYLFRIPKEEIVVILLSNKNSPEHDEISKGIAAILLNKPYEQPKEEIAIAVKDSILRKYTGEYELTPEFRISISLVDGMLKAQATGQPAFDLFARTENIFFLKVVKAEIEFVTGAEGKTEQLFLYQGGRKTPARKMK